MRDSIMLVSLGGLELRDAAGEPVALSPKRLALLVYLAVARPRGPHQRDALLALFYPESDITHARSAFRHLLHEVRLALGDDALISRPRETVAANRDLVRCDVWAFEEAVTGGDFEHAVALYTGPFLAGFHLNGCPDFAQWAEAERGRLQRAVTGSLEQLALFSMQRGDSRNAAGWWQQLLDHEPYASHVTLGLMEALADAGDRAAALQAAEDHAARLKRDFGAEPSRDVAAFADRLKARPPGRTQRHPAVAERLSAALAGRYAIEELIGVGGMALVYRAHDLKHNRSVALKVLRPELAAALGRERFLQEIAIAARLNHPNILPLHDSGAAGDLLYYVMPFIEGESLRERLTRDGPLPINEAVRLAGEVADALGYAHTEGVVHRDIKPENILISSGHSLVADFGVARAACEAGGRLTEMGSTVGTPVYMSVEQASGAPDIDARTDIYSLGCVLYEMLAGAPPYAGPTAQAIVAQKLSEPTPSVSLVRERVPQAVAAAIDRALAKAPADRYRTTREFADALEKPGEGVVPPPKRNLTRVAVASMAVFALALGGVWLARGGLDSGVTELDANSVAVMPWRVADASLAHWRRGAADLLELHLDGRAGRPLLAEPVRVNNLWRQAGGDWDTDLPRETELEVAARAGAGLMMHGAIVGTASSLHVSAELWDVASGKLLVQDDLQGVSDDLGSLIPRLVFQLLLRHGGDAVSGDADLLSTPLEAIQAYLAALGMERREAVDTLLRVLTIDSTFAPAALALYEVADYPALRQHRARALHLAWQHRSRLSEEDRVYVEVMHAGGGRHDVEAGLEVTPDNVRLLARYAWQLYNLGHIGLPDRDRRMLNALERRAALLGLSDEPGPHHWVTFEFATITHDTNRIRRYAALFLGNEEPDEVHFDFTHWYAYLYLGDIARLTRLRERPQEFCIGGVYAQMYLVRSGFPLDDWKSCLAWRDSTAVTTAERSAVAIEREWISAIEGRPTEAISRVDPTTRAGTPWGDFHPVVLALADSGVEAYEEAAARFVEAHRADQSSDAICHRELWRVSRGDTTRVRASMSRLRATNSARVCPVVLGTIAEFRGADSVAAGSMLNQLDSVLMSGPPLRSSGPEGPIFFVADLANLLSARMHYHRGEYDAGLAAARRRKVNSAVIFMRIFPAFLREEGRLAAQVGDTAGAIRAYDHYLTLRPDPEPGPIREEWEAVRQELAALVTERRR